MSRYLLKVAVFVAVCLSAMLITHRLLHPPAQDTAAPVAPPWWSRAPVPASAPGATPAARAAPAPSGAAVWIVTASGLNALANAGMSAGQLQHLFGGASTWIIENGGPSYPPSASWAAHKMIKFADEQQLASAISAGLPAGSTGVALDLEKWGQTPPSQQASPGAADQAGAQAARQHHLAYLVTPGTDLGSLAGGGSNIQGMISRVDAPAAKGAGMFDIQAQTLEPDPATYTSYVRRAAAQARAGQPGIKVYAQISSSPRGSVPPASVILQDIKQTRPYVNGYLLWIEPPGAPMMASVLHAIN
jgi:hypothetical protein